MAVVTPRMGSVSSCSGEGRANGEMSTRAAAQRMAAAVAWTLALLDKEGGGGCEDGIGAGGTESEFRIRGMLEVESERGLLKASGALGVIESAEVEEVEVV